MIPPKEGDVIVMMSAERISAWTIFEVAKISYRTIHGNSYWFAEALPGSVRDFIVNSEGAALFTDTPKAEFAECLWHRAEESFKSVFEAYNKLDIV